MEILKAEYGDLEEILSIQYQAFMGQARKTEDYSIEPLHQTLSNISDEFENGLILKAVDENNNIVGSVRSMTDGDTVYISKLFVHPELKNCGLGTNLLCSIEDESDAERAELFTNSLCTKNISFYKKNGYKPYKYEYLPDKAEKFDFIFFEKYLN
jgi:ribosomal protein S18 acetylase RimI-like enzyme